MKVKRLIRSLTSIFIAVIMLLSLFPVGISAMLSGASGTEYNLNVYIPKNTVGSVKFYSTTGFDAENRDTFDENNILSYDLNTETDAEYDIYTMSVSEGTYSFRAADSEGKSLGGGAVKVPAETLVDEDEKNSREETVYLRLSKTYITNKYDNIKATSDDFSVKLFNKLGTVTTGDAFVDENGNSCYPALIYVNGNALLYYVTATPSEAYAEMHQLKEERKSNISVQPYKNSNIGVGLPIKKDKVQSFKMELPQAIPFTIIAPAGAKAFMYDQILNFNTIKLEPVSIEDNGDGTYSHKFAYAGGSYRVSMDGKRTQAGYLSGDISADEATLNVTFPDGEPSEQINDWLGRKESGTLLNINERNKLSLAIGESYKVRAYRAPWQIINTDTDNIMIEPDFYFSILSGNDVIDIVQKDGGNAKGNWAEITAKKPGAAIIEVSYDAIDVAWGNKTELYGATNPRRSGVFVVTVGDSYGDVSGIQIDTEYYTHYFTGNSGVLAVSPEGDDVSVSVANVWQGILGEWKSVVGSNGTFDVPIANGNNILKITSDGITDYRVIKGSLLEAVIINKTHPENTESVCPGDELIIGFKGLFQWIPKFAGIYNPSKLYVAYYQGENRIESQSSQYNLPETTMEVRISDDAIEDFILTQGRLSGTLLGFVWSEHRKLNDNGVTTNFNAPTLPLEEIALPDLVIPVAAFPDNNETLPDNNENGGASSPGGNSGGIDISDKGEINTSNLKFDISDEDIKGYATVSFEDFGKRKAGESGVTYKTQLGKIIESISVPFEDGDSVAAVTLRLLKALNIKATYTGKPNNNFYLSSIGNFTLNGRHYSSFGEFDAGAASGWMIKHNNWFINMGASEFEVEDGDVIQWLYTCQLGEDIGCDWSNPSAEITGIKFKAEYGTLSPSFGKDVTEYTYTVSANVKSICLEAEQENYWSIVTYEADGKAYKAMESIPISDGAVITIESSFAEYMGHKPTDTDSITITILKNSSGSNNSQGTSDENDEETKAEAAKDNEASEKPAFSKTTFTDIKEKDWHYEAVKYVYENKLMEGTGNGFEPEIKMSRAMLVAVLFRMASPEGVENKHTFSDVPEGKWYSDAVNWAAAKGIVSGVSETEFAPDNDISREQMALIIYRFAKLQGYDVSGKADISAFADAGDISDWAIDSICWAKKTEILSGTSKTTLSPRSTATRAQVAAILMRFCENVAK